MNEAEALNLRDIKHWVRELAQREAATVEVAEAVKDKLVQLSGRILDLSEAIGRLECRIEKLEAQ